MDCPQLLALGLLLLALAAPRPNIALSNVGPPEGIEDYSPEVTVYRCRDCKSCTCKSGANDFEKFEKIADTQNEIFSDGIIELMTNKTHITVCFDEPNSCLERICSISWQKPGGSGSTCGILSSGENARVDISTEKTICCEADTSTRDDNPVLNCFYTQKSRPKLSTPAAAIPGSSEDPTCNRISNGGNQDRQSPEGENLSLDA